VVLSCELVHGSLRCTQWRYADCVAAEMHPDSTPPDWEFAGLGRPIASRVHVRYILSPVRLSVCRLSVTFVRPSQAIEIFGNVSTPFGTLAISDLSVKILRRSSQETRPTDCIPGVSNWNTKTGCNFFILGQISKQKCSSKN